MTIFRFALIKGLRNPATLLFNCILPLLLIFVRPLWTGGTAVSGYGLLILVIWGGSFLIAQGTLNDRESGALTRILAAPISMRSYLTQNLLAYMVPLTVQVALISALGTILYDWSLTLALGLFLCYTVFTIASVTMSFAWNCLFKHKETSFASFSAMVTFGSILSGAWIPLAQLPTVLQYAGAIFPAYWGVQGITSLIELGTMGTEYWMGIAAMALFAMAYLLYGGKRRMI
ncbi:MAG: ABC transporter permease [Oscillospiraceae bacterium]|nr:ABC transporter permease [Oscillospiraceae bacterium]